MRNNSVPVPVFSIIPDRNPVASLVGLMNFVYFYHTVNLCCIQLSIVILIYILQLTSARSIDYITISSVIVMYNLQLMND